MLFISIHIYFHWPGEVMDPDIFILGTNVLKLAFGDLAIFKNNNVIVIHYCQVYHQIIFSNCLEIKCN